MQRRKEKCLNMAPLISLRPGDSENVFDSTLKKYLNLIKDYGFLILWFGYILGTIYTLGFAAFLKMPREAALSNLPLILSNGFLCLLVIAFPATIFFLSNSVRSITKISLRKPYASWEFWATFTLISLSLFVGAGAEWLQFAVYLPFSAICNLVICFLWNPKLLPEKLTMKSQRLLLVILISMVIWMTGVLGNNNARRSQKSISLLIAPDAVQYVQGLGISFSQQKSNAASLSDPVTLVYATDHLYALRTQNGQVVYLSRDKVWGMK